ncbi:hypothetical protein POM88_042710 [Heracleum sosnowskyi]|uniref:Uncharacterized protein n=1 Tax=Heracleum sosnowskyi TaxID=360622 RepID=A0AAD8HH58_9APIA|nr:hypothetical protein POM88_042710 [Heracleum sosnowskyi]
MEANCIEKNICFFPFHHRRDKAFVKDSQPWHFDDHALALADVKESREKQVALTGNENIELEGEGNKTKVAVICDQEDNAGEKSEKYSKIQARSGEVLVENAPVVHSSP